MQVCVSIRKGKMLCRGVLRGFWAAIIWTRIGVGVGLLGELDKTARRRNRSHVKKTGIDRVWRLIEGYRGNAEE